MFKIHPPLSPSCLNLGLHPDFYISASSTVNGLEQLSPTFLAHGTGFMEDNFSGVVGWFGDGSSTLYTHSPPTVWTGS